MNYNAALRSYQMVQSYDTCRCGNVSAQPAGNPQINTVLPESGVGFATYNREEGGVDQVGLPATIQFLIDLGKDWAPHSEVPFQVGDISREGGGAFPPHDAHRNGTEADLRPFRLDGAMLPTNINDENYDRDRTRLWVQVVKEKAPGAVVLFNDPVLIKEGLTKYHKGHGNHLHLRVPQPTDTTSSVSC